MLRHHSLGVIKPVPLLAKLGKNIVSSSILQELENVTLATLDTTQVGS